MRTTVSALILLAACVSVSGCKKTPAEIASANLERAHQVDVARQDLQQIPPPSKGSYLAVQRFEDWQNPSLTVQDKMITIHVMAPDANPTELGSGTMLRPAAARQQLLNVDPRDLAQALNAIPKESWPYGRVIAIEEAHDAPASARPQLRRNIETALDTLSNLGIVAEEWVDGRPAGNR